MNPLEVSLQVDRAVNLLNQVLEEASERKAGAMIQAAIHSLIELRTELEEASSREAS
jgi:hypothetical protein